MRGLRNLVHYTKTKVLKAVRSPTRKIFQTEIEFGTCPTEIHFGMTSAKRKSASSTSPPAKTTNPTKRSLILKRLKAIGPGAIVAAAFIGPGTLTVASKSGGQFGYSLLWAVAFSTFACLVLQEMSARLGVVAQLGVGESIAKHFNVPLLKPLMIGLVLAAVLIGNAAYESGNLSGGVLGAQLAAQTKELGFWKPVIVLTLAATAFGLLWTAKYKIIERALIILVAAIGGVFLTAAVMIRPDFAAIANGLCQPWIPEHGWLTVVALIGTTVVPYNLFLHASTASQRWSSDSDLASARLDTAISVVGGGLITAAILIVATPYAINQTAGLGEQAIAASTPVELDSVFRASSEKLGGWFSWFLAFGFCVAGLSSAITAPLAAGYATAELFGWPKELSDWRFRATWIAVLATGVSFALFFQKPQQLLVFAQVANGLLLPVVAVFLIWATNNEAILGRHKNSWRANFLGIAVVIVTIGLGLVGVLKAFKVIG